MGRQQDQVSLSERGSLSAGNTERTVPQGLGLADITLERVVPRNVIVPLGQILLVLDHESDALQGLPGIIVSPHLGNAVTQLDLVRDLPVLRVRGVVSVRHDPFVDTEDTTRLENLEDLAIDAFKGRGVAGGLDGVDYEVGGKRRIAVNALIRCCRETHRLMRDHELTGIESVLPKLLGELHKIPLFEINQVAQSSLFRVLSSPGDLEIVVVQPGDPGVGKVGDLTGGATDTAADVEDLHTGLDTDLGSEVVFVTGELGEWESKVGVDMVWSALMDGKLSARRPSLPRTHHRRRTR